jgi:hypothetical protein
VASRAAPLALGGLLALRACQPRRAGSGGRCYTVAAIFRIAMSEAHDPDNGATHLTSSTSGARPFAALHAAENYSHTREARLSSCPTVCPRCYSLSAFATRRPNFAPPDLFLCSFAHR